MKMRHFLVFVSSHRSHVDFRKLKRNGVIIAEALARYMFNLSDKVKHENKVHVSGYTNKICFIFFH